RRTNLGMTYLNPGNPLYHAQWVPTTFLALAGGIIMTVSGLLYFIVFFGTLFSEKKATAALSFPETTSYHEERRIGFFDTFKPWLVMMVVIILIAYIPAIIEVMQNSGPSAPTFLPSNPTPGSR